MVLVAQAVLLEDKVEGLGVLVGLLQMELGQIAQLLVLLLDMPLVEEHLVVLVKELVMVVQLQQTQAAEEVLEVLCLKLLEDQAVQALLY
jgi:hypothetical protein